MPPELLVLALEYRRCPWRFVHLADPTAALPASFNTLVRDLGSALSPIRIADTAASLGCAPEELRAAVEFLLRQVLLHPSANHYRVLGVTPMADPVLIAAHYRALVGLFHPDRRSLLGHECNALDAARINTAYAVLRDAALRQHYDEELAGGDAQRPRETNHRPRVMGRSNRGCDHTWPVTRSVGALLSLAVCLSLAWLWSSTGGRPTLRMADQGVPRLEPTPRFLGSAPEREPLPRTRAAATTMTGGLVTRPTGPSPARGGDFSGQTDPERLVAPDAYTPTLLLEHFEQHLRGGDVAAILRLLTQDARISSAGAPDNRGGSELFQSAREHSLRLGPLSLNSTGRGRFRASARLERVPAARSSASPGADPGGGTIALEIVRQGAVYRIAALDYRIESPN